MSAVHSAVTNGHKWVEKFTRYEYRETFDQYRQTFENAVTEEILNCPDTGVLCETFLKELEVSRKKVRFWNRSTTAMEEKMTIVTYFVPMLLKSQEEKVKTFSEVFRNHWIKRFPNDPFDCTSYDVLISGFRHTILGIDVDRLRRKKDGN